MSDPIPTQPTTEPVFTCHHCGQTSAHPEDAREQYCGHCHHFCDDVDTWDRLVDVPLF
jgi:Zn finger protein HypA/HybF involved in hydrogenase expression